MKTRILIGTLIASMLTVIFAPAMLVGPASAGWTGRTDYFGNTRWSDDRGNSTTCRTDYFGTTRCN